MTGDLGEHHLGLQPDVWQRLAKEVSVIHNGALVHWVYPYSNLKPTNVQGTIDILALYATGAPKQLTFVSSTSVLDTPHYVELSARSIKSVIGHRLRRRHCHLSLSGSATGLGKGYGQSKWVSEYLVREAGSRGLRGAIVRLGYVTGDQNSGVTNTDDFLIRMWKGCIQLKCCPRISNTVNMVPVNHVARVVVAAALSPPFGLLGVAQVTSHPRLTFSQYLAALQSYGYDVPEVEYDVWKKALEQYASDDKKEQHAL